MRLGGEGGASYTLPMFSRKYHRELQGVAFASWTTDAAEQWAIQDALTVLEASLAECMERPIPEEEISDALTFLADRGPRANAFGRQFQAALRVTDAQQRYHTAATALQKLRGQFGPLARV
jgi:hypothetical protein